MAEIKLDFDNVSFIKLTKTACDGAAKKAVDKIKPESQAYIKSHAKTSTGKLASEIKLVKSKYPGGGWAIEAQGPGNYTRFYATFVELGSINNPRPIPYLRTPLKQNRNYIKGLFKDLV